MNSILQVFYATPEIRDYYLTGGADIINNTLNPHENFTCNMKKVILGMHSGEYSQAKLADKVLTGDSEKDAELKDEYYQEGIRPQLFKTFIGKNHEEFKTGQQQDTREYFAHLLDQMEKGEKQAKSGQRPSEVFEFEIEQRLECMACKRVKYIKQKATYLMVSAPCPPNTEKGTPIALDACLQAWLADECIDGVNCSHCNKAQNFIQRRRFLSYPTTLCLVLTRQVYDNWVPKKLDIELTMPEGEQINLEPYMGVNCELQEGEVGLPVEAEPMEEVEVDQSMVNELMQMGAPELTAKWAVYETRGIGTGEAAMEWFFSNMENPIIHTPLPQKPKGASGGAGAGITYDPESVMMITSMGLSEKQAKRGLRKCDFNIERAIDFVFNHMDDPDSEDEAGGMEVDQVSQVASQFENKNPGVGAYKLQSFITHLGASIHAGHYVAHNRAADGKWIYFNDDKVASSTEPPIGKGYMYFFRKN